MRCWALGFLAIFLCLPWAARAQAGNSDDLEISIVTMGPGPLIYERFGHIAVRLRNPQTGFDVLFDWGNFDFEEPNFIGKFVKGSLLYSMEGRQPARWLNFYAVEQDRTVTEQVLNLELSQKKKLRDLLSKNLANPKYLYDYYIDNCSTRVRDVLNQCVDGQLAPQWQAMTPHSLRWHTRRLTNVGLDNKTLGVLMDFCGGPKIDHPLSQWDAAFVPMELSKLLDGATLKRADGTTVPLVRERREINVTSLPGNFEPVDAPNPVRWTLPIGVVFASLTFACSRFFRIGYWILAGLWSGFATFGTLLFTVFIFFTRHWAIDWNQNYLQFSPVSIAILVAVLVPPLRKRFASFPLVAVGLSVVGLAITISHLTLQQGAPAVALALPIHLAVWAGWPPRRAVVEGTRQSVSIDLGKDSLK